MMVLEFERRKLKETQEKSGNALEPRLRKGDICNLENLRTKPYPGWVEELETFFGVLIGDLQAEVER